MSTSPTAATSPTPSPRCRWSMHSHEGGHSASQSDLPSNNGLSEGHNAAFIADDPQAPPQNYQVTLSITAEGAENLSSSRTSSPSSPCATPSVSHSSSLNPSFSLASPSADSPLELFGRHRRTENYRDAHQWHNDDDQESVYADDTNILYGQENDDHDDLYPFQHPHHPFLPTIAFHNVAIVGHEMLESDVSVVGGTSKIDVEREKDFPRNEGDGLTSPSVNIFSNTGHEKHSIEDNAGSATFQDIKIDSRRVSFAHSPSSSNRSDQSSAASPLEASDHEGNKARWKWLSSPAVNFLSSTSRLKRIFTVAYWKSTLPSSDLEAARQKTPLDLNRYVLLCIYMLYSFLTACTYFGWTGMSSTLYLSGAFAWLCPKNKTATSSSPLSEIYEDDQRLAGKPFICDDQDKMVQLFFMITLAIHAVSSAIGGAILDWRGPRTSALIGQSLNILSWTLFYFASEEVQSYIPAFITLGMGTDLGFLPVLKLCGAFPGSSALILTLLGAAASASFSIPVIQDAILKSYVSDASCGCPENILDMDRNRSIYQKIVLAYIFIGPGLCFLMVIFFFPGKPFLSQKEIDFLKNEGKNVELVETCGMGRIDSMRKKGSGAISDINNDTQDETKDLVTQNIDNDIKTDSEDRGDTNGNQKGSNKIVTDALANINLRLKSLGKSTRIFAESFFHRTNKSKSDGLKSESGAPIDDPLLCHDNTHTTPRKPLGDGDDFRGNSHHSQSNTEGNCCEKKSSEGMEASKLSFHFDSLRDKNCKESSRCSTMGGTDVSTTNAYIGGALSYRSDETIRNEPAQIDFDMNASESKSALEANVVLVEVPFLQQLFSFHFISFCVVYFIIVNVAFSYYQAAAAGGRFYSLSVTKALDLCLPLSFIPCIIFGKLIDMYGIMVITVVVNTCGILSFAFVLPADMETLHYLSTVAFMLYVSLYTSQVYCFLEFYFDSKHFGKLCGLSFLVGGLCCLIGYPLYTNLTIDLFKSNTTPVVASFVIVMFLMYFLLFYVWWKVKKNPTPFAPREVVQLSTVITDHAISGLDTTDRQPCLDDPKEIIRSGSDSGENNSDFTHNVEDDHKVYLQK